MTRGRKPIVREEINPEDYPILAPIYGNRWAAHGDGWAVHGNTPDEARENYRKAEERRQEILARGPWRDRVKSTVNQPVVPE